MTLILDEHDAGPRSAPNRGPRPKTTVGHHFCAVDEDAEVVLVGPATIGDTRLGVELQRLIVLGAAHGGQQLVAALRSKTVPPLAADLDVGCGGSTREGATSCVRGVGRGHDPALAP